MISNCPVTRSDILAAEEMFGPDAGALKGKTTRSKSFTLHGRVINIPARTIERYSNVILSEDMIQVNVIQLIVKISKISVSSPGNILVI